MHIAPNIIQVKQIFHLMFRQNILDPFYHLNIATTWDNDKEFLPLRIYRVLEITERFEHVLASMTIE